MKEYIDLDLSRCCACGACAIACMDQHDLLPGGELHPFRTVFRDELGPSPQPEYYSVACMHCKDAPCVLACPVGCLYKDEGTGLTLYDTTHCIGCHSCALACPFGAPGFGPDGKMRKCDGCIDRLGSGMEPACVRACAFQALRFVKCEEDAPPPEHSLRALCEDLAQAQR